MYAECSIPFPSHDWFGGSKHCEKIHRVDTGKGKYGVESADFNSCP